jgi:hypothetical protein
MTQSYFSDDVNIQLEMPKSWTTAKNEQIPLIIFAPQENDFRANMTVTMRELKPSTQEHFEDLIRKTRVDHEADYKGFTLIEEAKWMQDDFPAYQEVYHWNSDEDNIPLTQIFALIMTGPDALYSIHCTTLRSLEATYLPPFKAIIKSFEFYE